MLSYKPENKKYEELAAKLKKKLVSVDLFMIGQSKPELSTVSVLSSGTGGQTFYFPHADPYQ